MNKFLFNLLEKMKLSYEDYLDLTKDISLSNLENPDDFINMDLAYSRINKAINNNEKIMIYGDYDCDGFCSVSIMINLFKKLNYHQVGYYIPSRFKDGYGINEDMVRLIHKKGYKLIITVDNGVSQFSSLELAKQLGIDVIITDHHEFQSILPTCYTIIHPFLKHNNLCLPQCGAYVVFMLASKLLGYYDEYLLTLASLATISDLMPLKSHNRNVVRLGIQSLIKNKYPSFNMLLDATKSIDEKTFGFDIAPKINAVGRIIEDISINRVIEYFSTNDYSELLDISQFINEANNKRKALTLDAFKSLDLSEFKDDKVIVIKLNNINEGLIGLVANRIMNETKKPCVVFTNDQFNLLKGSARSLTGFALNEAFEELKDILERFGGHANAGGLSIKEENFFAFKERINALAQNKIIHEEEKIILDCQKEDFNYENYQIIKSLSPFGEGFIEPYLSIIISSNNITYLSLGAHIKGNINQNCSFIGFNFNKNYGVERQVKLIGRLELDNFRGGKKLSFKVSEVIELE